MIARSGRLGWEVEEVGGEDMGSPCGCHVDRKSDRKKINGRFIFIFMF